MLELTVEEISKRIGEEVKVVETSRQKLQHGDVVCTNNDPNDKRFIIKVRNLWYGITDEGEIRSGEFQDHNSPEALAKKCNYTFVSRGFKITPA